MGAVRSVAYLVLFAVVRDARAQAIPVRSGQWTLVLGAHERRRHGPLYSELLDVLQDLRVLDHLRVHSDDPLHARQQELLVSRLVLRLLSPLFCHGLICIAACSRTLRHHTTLLGRALPRAAPCLALLLLIVLTASRPASASRRGRGLRAALPSLLLRVVGPEAGIIVVVLPCRRAGLWRRAAAPASTAAATAALCEFCTIPRKRQRSARALGCWQAATAGTQQD
jgi:hypothetical protein